MKLSSLWLLMFSLFFLSCTKPRIDASSDEKMKESIENVRNSLSKEKREEFDQALQAIVANQISFEGILQQGLSGVSSFQAKTREALNNKTASEVIEAAKQIEKERLEKEKQEALQEIKDLEAKKAAAEKDRLELEKFKVTRSRLVKRERQYLGPEAIIELSVVNQTNMAVSRAYFVGTLASPGRSVPWHKDSFNYQIPGGLEPGEKAAWKLTPNILSSWGSVNAPSNAVFTVEVVQLDGPDGKPSLSTSQFSEDDQKRLDELRQKFPVDTP